MRCPRCGNDYCKMSSDTKISGKDYSIGRGICGEMLFGSAGFACGFTDNRNIHVDAYWICEKCGYRFKA